MTNTTNIESLMFGSLANIKIPPAELIRYTCGTDSAEEYTRSGLEVSTMLTLAANRFGGKLADLGPILDFGCGTGRVLGAMEFGRAEVTGCDVGSQVSKFSKEAYPNFKVLQTPLMPPLPFEDNSFRLIYSFSVFSHLEEKVEHAWLQELHRVGTSNCLYLLTVHGEWMIEQTVQPNEQVEIYKNGFGFKKVHVRKNSNLDFPDYYEASYHTNNYIRENWSKYFEVLEIIKGDDPRRYLYSELQFASKGGVVPDFRPMGQDLVVARRR